MDLTKMISLAKLNKTELFYMEHCEYRFLFSNGLYLLINKFSFNSK